MALKSGSVWAVDIGNNSLKALHLSTEGGAVEVIGFANIQHDRVLTGAAVTAAERDELIALSLRRFVSQNDLSKDDVVVSVPSQNSFARFVKLPPVEAKRIPEIVKFEAVQQIPFDINEVQWDWQLMTEAGSAENEVGIFAIKNDVVSSVLEHFGRENVTVSYVQMVPMALYNYVLYDRADLGSSDNQAIVVLDIGAENTDLVVCTRSTVWQRCILIGGDTFTKAIADTFKLNFEKAEKLKRTAPMSKYARQIFQAMRPVFTDLASEIQRSLSFYNSSNPNTKLSRIIALGGGTKMRGLLKYLQQTLQIPVERPDSFKKLTISLDVSAAKFHESVSDFGIVYGLGLQGLGLGRIESNLLPRSIARSMAWAGKARYFTAAACLLLAVSVLSFARTIFDKANWKNKQDIRDEIRNVISTAGQAEGNLEAEKRKEVDSEAIMQKAFGAFKYRDVIPLLHQTIISALPNKENNRAQAKLYEAFANGNVETVKGTARKERKQIFVTGMSVYFVDDVNTAQFPTGFLAGAGERWQGRVERFVEDYGAYETTRESRIGDGGTSGYSAQTFYDTTGEGQIREKKQFEEGPGFVVTIAGYSPYKDIGKLVDPVGVEDDPNSWGVVTRLLHLDNIFDGNSPFKLYNRTEARHFKFEKGEVDLETPMPPGIGILDVRFRKAKTVRVGEGAESGEWILIDPMTKETISKIAELDKYGQRKLDGKGKPIYNVNDRWFVLNLKFIWKDAPEEIKRPMGAMGPMGTTGTTGTTGSEETYDYGYRR